MKASVLFAGSMFILAMVHALPGVAQERGMRMKSEAFDRDPNWDGVNNRIAHERKPVTVRQDFGYSPTSHAGGGPSKGEIGGTIFEAIELAYYGKVIPDATFEQPLTASGTIACMDGEFQLLLGFFNPETANEWRTANSIAIRMNGRGKHFYAYVEYCTSKWRAGGDNPQHFGGEDESGKWTLFEFESGGKPHTWSITYDPNGNNGGGVVTATMDDKTAICHLDPGHKSDGATFNRFGVLNVMKSAGNGTEVYLDNISINGGSTEAFDKDPNWDGKGNRNTYESRIVRPWFDFGFSPETNIAGGKAKGELGGIIFRGDCRKPETMAYYGDKVGPLTLDKPFKASGKVAITRGITDSATVFGFFHSKKSMEISQGQDIMAPKCLVGAFIEGPSSEGFFVYPQYRVDGDGFGSGARAEQPLRIYPDGATHDWSLDYDPAGGAEGHGRITVTLDGKSVTCDITEDDRRAGATFDRFGIVTTWIDGHSQNVYFDDLTYTVSH